MPKFLVSLHHSFLVQSLIEKQQSCQEAALFFHDCYCCTGQRASRMKEQRERGRVVRFAAMLRLMSYLAPSIPAEFFELAAKAISDGAGIEVINLG